MGVLDILKGLNPFGGHNADAAYARRGATTLTTLNDRITPVRITATQVVTQGNGVDVSFTDDLENGHRVGYVRLKTSENDLPLYTLPNVRLLVMPVNGGGDIIRLPVNKIGATVLKVKRPDLADGLTYAIELEKIG
jgi:hypothetical protein